MRTVLTVGNFDEVMNASWIAVIVKRTLLCLLEKSVSLKIFLGDQLSKIRWSSVIALHGFAKTSKNESPSQHAMNLSRSGFLSSVGRKAQCSDLQLDG